MGACRTVIGIDVGSARKGLHAVALQNGKFQSCPFSHASDVADWCREQDAQVIAIDAPCKWASAGGSRLAERTLAIGGTTVQCFKTPTRFAVRGRAFYDWVFNGELIYKNLLPDYQLFDGTGRTGKIMLETFPHAVVCSLAGKVIPAKQKARTRRSMLIAQGYDHAPLANIDFVDAALCALTAERFLLCRTISFGDQAEGFIVVPK